MGDRLSRFTNKRKPGKKAGVLAYGQRSYYSNFANNFNEIETHSQGCFIIALEITWVIVMTHAFNLCFFPTDSGSIIIYATLNL